MCTDLILYIFLCSENGFQIPLSFFLFAKLIAVLSPYAQKKLSKAHIDSAALYIPYSPNGLIILMMLSLKLMEHYQ